MIGKIHLLFKNVRLRPIFPTFYQFSKLQSQKDYTLMEKLNLSQKKQLSVIELVNVCHSLENVTDWEIVNDVEFRDLVRKSINSVNTKAKGKIMPLEDIKAILILSGKVQIGKAPRNLLKDYASCIMNNSFSQHQIENFPKPYLQILGPQLLATKIRQFLENGKKQQLQQLIEIFKNFSQVIGKKQLISVDQFLVGCLQRNQLHQELISKIVAIFNHCNTKGYFIQQLQQNIIQRKTITNMSSKNLLKITLNLLQLGCNQQFSTIQQQLMQLPKNQQLIVLQMMHKYKIGSEKIWKYMYEQYQVDGVFVRYDVIFPIVAGFYRNYQYMPQLAIQFLYLDPKLTFITNFTDQQYIEFFLVVYNNTIRMPVQNHKSVIETFNTQIVSYNISKQYLSIKNIFIALITQQPKQILAYLKKANLTDQEIVLISIIRKFSDIVGNVNTKEKQAYKQELLRRIDKQQQTQLQMQRIVLEELVRVKLLTGKNPDDYFN